MFVFFVASGEKRITKQMFLEDKLDLLAIFYY